jgi:hypothetical protein
LVADLLGLDTLLAELVLGLGLALLAGNGFALIQAWRGTRPDSVEGDLRRGRVWFLLVVGLLMALWGGFSLLARG